ncbi:cell division protein FtsQ/DivIB [Aurantibacter sp.]|uniref:cell division protein FtsQ/DivIB n=1 Tax=Aurantibacter sp. TaxID=2807103 RepID=UPI0035C85614
MITIWSFSSSKNNKREVGVPEISFVGSNTNLFITSQAVSNLLIQSQGSVQNVTKEVLDLNGLELSLTKNPMVSKAEVYVNVLGQLSAKVEQKQPVARVFGTTQFYIDSNGEFMPLSNNYTERVPLVTGKVVKTDLQTVFAIANYIKSDDFLKKQVVEIHQNDDKTIELKLRSAAFVVQLGTLNQLEKKINNLKAFFIKANNDNVLSKYKVVNLQFDNQVVCTKF